MLPMSRLEMPGLRRLRHGQDGPRLTRQVPTVEIFAGAVLGLIAGLAWGASRGAVVDLGWSLICGTLFGLLIGWLIGLFTGATGTLSPRTVLVNMVHIVWVLTVAIFFVGIIALLAALAGAVYDSDRRDI
jgi:small-conductance mechanosensitive channel